MVVTEDCNDSDMPLLACASVNLDSNTDCLACESNFHLVYGSKYCLKKLQLPVFIQYITFPYVCLGKKIEGFIMMKPFLGTRDSH